MKWILIMVILSGSAGAGLSPEFDNEVACREAIKTMLEVKAKRYSSRKKGFYDSLPLKYNTHYMECVTKG